MKPGTLLGLFAGAFATMVWCCSSTEPPASTPQPPDATADSVPSAPPDAAPSASAPPFVLPPPSPRETATCKHPPVVAACDARWCTLPKGCFIMGSPETFKRRAAYGEEEREVTFTHDLVVSRYETTQEEWVAAGLPNRSGPDPAGIGDCQESRCPVGNVSWWDAWVYANLANDREGRQHCAEPRECSGTPGGGLQCKRIEQLVPSLYDCAGYRLPTRAEFEYAAKGGTATEFYSGPMTGDGDGPELHLREIAWFTENSGHHTHPVGTRLANHWGLFDMLGNAGEWNTQEANPSPNPEGPLVDWRGVLDPTVDTALFRGGFVNTYPVGLRAMSRSFTTVRNVAGHGGGFRLVRSVIIEADAGNPRDGGPD